ncbi:hypothetical protein JW721_00270 [Candidatus Micrarchaeota archaeon]|nr:hypothetical protein [Candidatus Micrarchaeota archaeon]
MGERGTATGNPGKLGGGAVESRKPPKDIGKELSKIRSGISELQEMQGEILEGQALMIDDIREMSENRERNRGEMERELNELMESRTRQMRALDAIEWELGRREGKLPILRCGDGGECK